MPNKARAFRLSPLAERDLEDIWLYTFRTWSRGQADSYHATIIQTLEGLASGGKSAATLAISAKATVNAPLGGMSLSIGKLTLALP